MSLWPLSRVTFLPSRFWQQQWFLCLSQRCYQVQLWQVYLFWCDADISTISSSHLSSSTLFSVQQSVFSYIVADYIWIPDVLTCSVWLWSLHSMLWLYSWIFCLMWESLFFRYSHLSLFSKYVGSWEQKKMQIIYTVPNYMASEHIMMCEIFASSKKV